MPGYCRKRQLLASQIMLVPLSDGADAGDRGDT